MAAARQDRPGAVPADVVATATAFTALFHPHVEAVVHDVARDRVVAIWNAFSARKPGAESFLDPALLADVPPGEVLGPYEQVDRRGRRLSSVSVRVDEGRLLLCLNFDRSALLNRRKFAPAALLNRRGVAPSALLNRRKPVRFRRTYSRQRSGFR